MTPNLLDELEKIVALSEKATKGWRLKDCASDRSVYQIVDATDMVIAFPRRGTGGAQEKRTREDTAHLMVDAVNFLRTHAPTIADMAKRLEAAERDARKCWALHLKGPDDVVAAPSREAAEIVARNFNAYWDARKHLRDHDIRVVAEVIEWEHGAVEHAKSAAQHWPEYADLLDAATQEGEG